MSSPGSDVEFLEPDGTVAGPEEPPAPRVRRASRTACALALAVIGGALAVVAAFARAYRVVFPAYAGQARETFSVDGWGRYGAREVTNHAHAARLGIVLCAAAGVVVVALALQVVARRRERWRPVGSAAVVLAAGTILATGVALLLTAQATRDSYQAALRASVVGNGEPASRPLVVGLSLGPLLWLSIASAVTLVAAVIVHPRERRELALAPPVPPAPAHRDDELLS